VLLAASVPGPVRAHSELRRAEPAQGAVLAESPTELRLAFNEPVQVTTFRLLDAAGRAVPLRRDGDASPSREERAVPVAPIPSGPWRIEWRAISADGHPIRGTIQFQVQGDHTP
jgi:methionine-rich copper-binding protein CopC